MRDFVLDILLPPTDRIVLIQWLVMIAFWIGVIIATRNKTKDTRTFVIGLAMLNLAWFAARTIH